MAKPNEAIVMEVPLLRLDMLDQAAQQGSNIEDIHGQLVAWLGLTDLQELNANPGLAKDGPHAL